MIIIISIINVTNSIKDFLDDKEFFKCLILLFLFSTFFCLDKLTIDIVLIFKEELYCGVLCLEDGKSLHFGV